MSRLFSVSIFFVAAAFVVAAIFWVNFADRDLTRVIFLDVGQGDAILLTAGDRQILIDGGADGRVLAEELARWLPFWDRTIEVLVATHQDSDHIGAQTGIIDNYRIGAVVYSAVSSSTSVAEIWRSAMEKTGAPLIAADSALSIKFFDGERGVLRFLYPRTVREARAASDTNSGSLVSVFEVSGRKFLLTGDLPAERENDLSLTSADVLKVAHHGSRFSTGGELLDRLRPSEAVISVGRDNSYGHPAEEVLRRLRERGIEILRTDESGTIVYECRRGGDCVRIAEP